MAIAEKRARSARKFLEASRRESDEAEKGSITVAPGEDEKAEVRAPKPQLGYRIRLLLSGALVALALAGGAFVAFDPGDRSPSEELDRGPAPGFDPQP